MKTFIIVLCLIALATCDVAPYCWWWKYPEKPNFPTIDKVQSSVYALSDGFLFNITNIPLMENVLLTIPDLFIGPRDEIPDASLDGLSSGTTCHYEESKLICPDSGSIFSNPKFICQKVNNNGCLSLTCEWKATIHEIMKAGRVKKVRDGDMLYMTFYYYLSYLTPERDQTIQRWGHGNQILLEFHTALQTVYRSSSRTAEVYSTYFYWVRPETFQPVEYITVSTSKADDAIINVGVVDPSPLGFYKTLEWADKGYSLFQFESNYALPKDKKPINATLRFAGTYCSSATKDANSGRWKCEYNDPFVNVNTHVFQAEDIDQKQPAILTSNAVIYHCYNYKPGGDCKPHQTGPIPLGAGPVYVVWRSEQLDMDEFHFDTHDISIRVFFEDSWLGPGLKEFILNSGDYDILFPRDIGNDLDPAINPDNKLMLFIRFNPTPHLEDIDSNSGWLNLTVNILPATTEGVHLLGNGKMAHHPTIQVTSARQPKGPVPSQIQFPAWAYAIIGGASGMFLVLAVVGTVMIVKRRRATYHALA